MKIAILYICTGYYDIFWKDFYLSFEQYFIPQSEKHYFVFTDANSLYDEGNNPRIHKIYQEAYPWPYSTLKRYHIFMKHISLFENYDYIFFMNANVICTQPISDKDFLPRTMQGESLTVVQHPYAINKPPRHYTYERNPSSSAFISYSQGKYYICGGINGGTASAFCDLIRQVYFQIETDLKHGIIALWHDESHINKYILGRSDYRMLPPSYCYPEGAKLPYTPILVVREKSKCIPVDKIKQTSHSLPSRLLHFARKRLTYLHDNICYIKEKLFTQT